MREQGRHSEDALDRYLDNQMDADERRAFEADADAATRGEIARQRAIDDSLKRQFDAPDVERVLRHALSQSDRGPRRRSTLLRFLPLAAAAVVLIACSAVWFLRSPPPTRPIINNSFQPESMAAAYASRVESGFTPEIVCDNDLEFAGAAWGVSREGLLLAAAPNVQALGWAHSTAVSPKTMMLLVRVDQQPVTVFFDTRQSAQQYADRLKPPCGDKKLYLYRRTIGEAALFEVSPLPESRVLDLLQPAPYSEQELREAYAGW